jgi:hypothetical protein
MTVFVLRGPLGWTALAGTFAIGAGLMVAGATMRTRHHQDIDPAPD